MRFLFFILIGVAQATHLDKFVQHPALKTASVGVHIMSLEGKEPFLSHQPDLALIPASTLKAVTTATALDLLEPDFTFKTRLYLSGDDLIIKGGGDPTLSASSPETEFPAWLALLQEAGLTEIKGDIIADPSRFESRTTPDAWPWGDIGNYYGAGPSGLNFHRNTYILTFRPGKVGSPAKFLGSYPTPPEVTFENHMLTSSSGTGDNGYVYAAPNGNCITMRGTIPFGGKFSIKGALPNPPLACATYLRDYLRRKKFPVSGKAKVQPVDTKNATLLHTQESPPLSKIIHATNHRSVNLYADSIYKALSSKGTSAASFAKLKLHWVKNGVKMAGFITHDGSGLAPRNTLTARQLCTIIQKASTGKHAQIFKDSLPVSGKSGTLRNFGKGTPIENRVWAKSGGLTRVRTYAGLYTTLTGDTYAFAILTNNAIGDAQPAIVEFLTGLIK